MKGIITISDTTDAIFKLDGKIHFHDQDTVRSSSISKILMDFPSAACICASRIKAVTERKIGKDDGYHNISRLILTDYIFQESY